MLLNQHLYNRALIKRKNDQKRRGLDSLTPKTSLDGLSINLQKELLKEEKPDEFKKVVIEDKKRSNNKKEEDDKVDIKEDYFSDLEPDEEFELIEDPVKEDNELIEEPDKELKNEQSGGGSMDNDKNVKKVVVSFF
jgi:hypothetical protein